MVWEVIYGNMGIITVFSKSKLVHSNSGNTKKLFNLLLDNDLIKRADGKIIHYLTDQVYLLNLRQPLLPLLNFRNYIVQILPFRLDYC